MSKLYWLTVREQLDVQIAVRDNYLFVSANERKHAAIGRKGGKNRRVSIERQLLPGSIRSCSSWRKTINSRCNNGDYQSRE